MRGVRWHAQHTDSQQPPPQTQNIYLFGFASRKFGEYQRCLVYADSNREAEEWERCLTMEWKFCVEKLATKLVNEDEKKKKEKRKKSLDSRLRRFKEKNSKVSVWMCVVGGWHWFYLEFSHGFWFPIALRHRCHFGGGTTDLFQVTQHTARSTMIRSDDRFVKCMAARHTRTNRTAFIKYQCTHTTTDTHTHTHTHAHTYTHSHIIPSHTYTHIDTYIHMKQNDV